jgi:type IV pilus assembly protein PilN
VRIDINLASRPYEDARRFGRRWGLLLAGTALVTVALVWGASFRVREWQVEDRAIRSLQAQIAQGNREIAQAQAFLNRPENRDTRDKSQVLNGLIARKAFSWTEVFSDLEKIMPPRLHVVSIRPELNDENQLELRLAVAGESRQRALDLVKKMEVSRRFKEPEVLSESTLQPGQNNTAGGVQFDIRALYVPQALEPGGAGEAQTAQAAPPPQGTR